jgi:hypothetical protein
MGDQVVILALGWATRCRPTEMLAGMADGGGGFFEMINDLADEDIEFDWIGKLSAAYGIPMSFTMTSNPAGRVRQ